MEIFREEFGVAAVDIVTCSASDQMSAPHLISLTIRPIERSEEEVEKEDEDEE